MLSDSHIRVSIGGILALLLNPVWIKAMPTKKMSNDVLAYPKSPGIHSRKSGFQASCHKTILLTTNHLILSTVKGSGAVFTSADVCLRVLDAITRLHKIFITANPILKSLKIR